MAKLWKRRMIGAKSETTQNTGVSLLGADWIGAYDFTVTPNVEQLTSEIASNYLGSPANVSGLKSQDVSIKFWLKGSGTAGTANAPVDALFQAAGLSGSIVAATSITYKPLNTPPSANFVSPAKSATIAGNYDGLGHTITGSVGSLKMVFEQGKKADMEYTGKGLWTSTSDVLFASASYTGSAVVEPVCSNIAFVLNGYTFIADKLELDFANEVQAISDVNSANGIYGFAIVDRKPTGKLTCLAVNVASNDIWGKYENATILSGSCTIGTNAGNKFTFTLNSVQYSDVKYSNKNGLLNMEVSMKFNETDANTPWVTVTAL